MAEESENTSSQASSVLSTKEESPNPSISQVKDAENYSLQDIVEVEFQPDCPVCLQPAFYPVRLPCGHIFCFLCIKGVALRSRKCAICRQAIANDFFDKPTLVKVSDIVLKVKAESKENKAEDTSENEYLWYYEGRNGWWQYDDKTSKEVELSFKGGKRSCTLLIAGFLYLIDFENMFQMRRNEPGRRRRIKRDKRDVESKGVAGIRKLHSPQGQEVSTATNSDSNVQQPSNISSSSQQSNPQTPSASVDSVSSIPVVSQGGADSPSNSDAVTTVTDK